MNPPIRLFLHLPRHSLNLCLSEKLVQTQGRKDGTKYRQTLSEDLIQTARDLRSRNVTAGQQIETYNQLKTGRASDVQCESP